MRINKIDGAILSLLLMSPYVFFYHEWVKQSSQSLQLTLFFFFGIFLHFLRKIEAGTVAELLFFEKSTKHYWQDGFCLVPSFLPALHNVGIYLLWNLKKSIEVTGSAFNPNINIEHYKDQRKPEYIINAKATLLALSVHNFFGNMLSWWIAPFKDMSELKFQKLGFRIILLALICGGISNFFTDASTTINRYNPFQTKKEIVTILVQLNDGFTHSFPELSMFEEQGDTTTTKYMDIGEDRFILYPKRTGANLARITVETRLCALVPVGKKIVFETKYKPVRAENMKREVRYIKRPEFVTVFQKIRAFLFSDLNTSKGYILYDSWQYINTNWHTVENDNYTLTAEALDRGDIADTNVGGGLVCF